MKKLLALGLMMICVLFCYGCGTPEEEQEDITYLETPYCSIALPSSFDGVINTVVESENPFIVSFKTISDEQTVMTICFNEKKGDFLGTLVLEDEDVEIYVELPMLEDDSSSYEKNSRYQEDGINTLIKYLGMEYDFHIGEKVNRNEGNTFEIETDIVALKYPMKWENVITVKQQDQQISFMCDDVHIFDIYFNSPKGDIIGEYKGTTISVESYEINETLYSKDKYDILTQMQEDVNVIIEHLVNDNDFKPAN